MAVTYRSADIQFAIGTVLMLERTLDDQRVKGSSRIVGAHEPRFLLAELPYSYGRPMFTAVGEKCIVRLLHDGKVLGFKAEIVKIVLTPFPLVMLEYPESVEEMSLRQHERLDCSIPAQVTVPPSAAPDGRPAATPALVLTGLIVDLGQSGCQVGVPTQDAAQGSSGSGAEVVRNIIAAGGRLHAADRLQAECTAGRVVPMTFELPAPASTRFPNVACEIRWNRIQGVFFLMGLRFANPSTALTEAIRTIVEHQHRFFSRAFA